MRFFEMNQNYHIYNVLRNVICTMNKENVILGILKSGQNIAVASF